MNRCLEKMGLGGCRKRKRGMLMIESLQGKVACAYVASDGAPGVEGLS